MSENRYPSDPMQDLRALQRTVADNEAVGRQPLTTASKGWHIPAQPTPATPASGGHLYAVGSEPWWKASTGATYSLKAQVPVAGFVANPTNTTSSAGPSYSQTQVQAMVDTIDSLSLRLTQALNALKTAGLMSPF